MTRFSTIPHSISSFNCWASTLLVVHCAKWEFSSILLIIASIKYFAFSESYIFSCFSQSLNSSINIILFVADIICQFIYKLGFWITVYYFTPLHTIISENTIEIYYIIYDFESNKAYWEESGYVWNQYVIPTVLVLNLIFSLIFNEIIILKCCKLDYHTKKRINNFHKTSNFTQYINQLNILSFF